jgi:hypothetical protein
MGKRSLVYSANGVPSPISPFTDETILSQIYVSSAIFKEELAIFIWRYEIHWKTFEINVKFMKYTNRRNIT